MKTKEELLQYIINNFLSKGGDIDLNNLDFTDAILPNGEPFKGTIWMHNLRTNGDLYQNGTDVGGNLSRGDCEIKGNLWQTNNIVKGETYNDFTEHNKVMILNNEDWVEDTLYIKTLEELTKEQLINRIRELEKGDE